VITQRAGLWVGFFLVVNVCSSGLVEVLAQPLEEDLQEVLQALEMADLPLEQIPDLVVTPKPQPPKYPWQGQWDSRVSFNARGHTAITTRLQVNNSWLSSRAKFHQSSAGENLLAHTTKLRWGPMSVSLGGVGMSAGFGLLLQGPGRAGSLAAGQALRSVANGVKGWATTPDNRSCQGVGLAWRGLGWSLSGIHGSLGGVDTGGKVNTVLLEKRWSSLNLALGVARWLQQQGATLSGQWKKNSSRFGFEWASWESRGLAGRHGVFLVSFRTRLPKGLALESQWSAANSSDGPASGARPPLLNAWGGAGWAMRLVYNPPSVWRFKILWARNNGVDWDGPHRKQEGQFFDLVIQGKPRPGWEVTGRWHNRLRAWEAWSDTFPWLPPSPVGQDERSGCSVDLKREGQSGSWVYSYRGLQRTGVTTAGRRSLASIRNRRSLGGALAMQFSFQMAWGDPVDLVSAINPLLGLVLPRHWGHWSSEVLVGLELRFLGLVTQTAFSRREPAAGADRHPEYNLWLGARARW
jgi:hypothetical protein